MVTGFRFQLSVTVLEWRGGVWGEGQEQCDLHIICTLRRELHFSRTSCPLICPLKFLSYNVHVNKTESWTWKPVTLKIRVTWRKNLKIVIEKHITLKNFSFSVRLFSVPIQLFANVSFFNSGSSLNSKLYLWCQNVTSLFYLLPPSSSLNAKINPCLP